MSLSKRENKEKTRPAEQRIKVEEFVKNYKNSAQLRLKRLLAILPIPSEDEFLQGSEDEKTEKKKLLTKHAEQQDRKKVGLSFHGWRKATWEDLHYPSFKPSFEGEQRYASLIAPLIAANARDMLKEDATWLLLKTMEKSEKFKLFSSWSLRVVDLLSLKEKKYIEEVLRFWIDKLNINKGTLSMYYRVRRAERGALIISALSAVSAISWGTITMSPLADNLGTRLPGDTSMLILTLLITITLAMLAGLATTRDKDMRNIFNSNICNNSDDCLELYQRLYAQFTRRSQLMDSNRPTPEEAFERPTDDEVFSRTESYVLAQSLLNEAEQRSQSQPAYS